MDVAHALVRLGVRAASPLLATHGFALILFAQPVVRQGDTIHVTSTPGPETVRMDGRAIHLFKQQDGNLLGLMPVPVLQEPGRYTLEFLKADGSADHTGPVTVRTAHFPSQNVVMGKALTELKPSPDEATLSEEFRKNVSEKRYWEEPLIAPIPGCMTSLFGVRRLQNGRPTGNFHGGVDLRGAEGAPVHASASGVVKLVRSWNLHGNTVGIDHGQGLESMYLHMSKFAIAEGAIVQQGDVIGYVGTTGRSTAPHLHWTLYVNGVPVNPGQWVRLRSCTAK